MKRLIIILTAIAFFIPAISFAKDTYVRGYYRNNGTYVQPYTRSAPDSYKWNNYGSKTDEEKKGGYSDPYSRDKDNDGTPNYLDTDDDNDGRHDDSE
ncbi:MAG: hypothetical protein WA162_03470 [Thermodesulfobacteriota bacterium]